MGKKGRRALGVAESFREDDAWSHVAGVVMRGDLVIDGVGTTAFEVGGMDSTEKVIELFNGFSRNDINLIILSGSIVSLYNIIDIERVHRSIGKPVICLSYREGGANIAKAIRHHFKGLEKERMSALRKLGRRKAIRLSTGYRVYVRLSGITTKEAKAELDRFTLQGKVPEPVRVARLVASADLNKKS